MKRCCTCKRSKKLHLFNKRAGGYQSSCRRCSNKRSRKHYLSNKADYLKANQKRRGSYAAWLVEQKRNPCLDCGGKFDPVCMDFDHCRGVKEANISALVANRVPYKRLEEEIAKCDLVCANCHRLRTKNRRIARSFKGRTRDC